MPQGEGEMQPTEPETDIFVQAAANDTISRLIERRDVEFIVMEGKPTRRLTIEGARRVLERFYRNSTIAFSGARTNIGDWVCDPSGFDWCGKVASLGKKKALEALYKVLHSAPVQLSVALVALIVDAVTLGLLSALTAATAALDWMCKCSAKTGTGP